MRALAILAVCVGAAFFVAHVFQAPDEALTTVEHEEPSRDPLEPRESTVLEGRPTPPVSSTDVEVFGTVVDAAGAAAGGATVVLSLDETNNVEQRARWDGSFRFLVPRLAPGKRAARLDAESGTTAATRAIEWTEPDPAYEEDVGKPLRVDVGELRLEETAETLVQVRAPGGGAATATVYATLLGPQGLGPTWSAETGARGLATLPRMPRGTYRFLADAQGYGRAAVVLRLPRSGDDPVVLVLDEERVVTVRVVSVGDRTPVAGAEVRVIEFPTPSLRWPVPSAFHPAKTDAGGVVRVRGRVAEETLGVRVTAPGWSSMRAETTVPPGVNEVQVWLGRSRTVRWLAKNAPAEGSMVGIVPWGQADGATLPGWGTIRNGDLEVDDWPASVGVAAAVAQDGSMARLEVDVRSIADRGGAAAFKPPRTLKVTLRRPSGQPLAGWTVRVVPACGTATPSILVTDARGEATFRGIYGAEGAYAQAFVQVRLGGGFRDVALPRVDLQRGDGAVTGLIPETGHVQVEVSADGGPVPQGTKLFVDELLARDTRADGTTLFATWQPIVEQNALRVRVEAPGWFCVPVWAEFPVGLPPDPVRVRVELARAASLEVQVALPNDGFHAIVLERGLTLKGPWQRAGEVELADDSAVPRTADAGRVVWPKIAPGYYRVVDDPTGITSEPEWILGGRSATIRLDLTRAGWVRGRLAPPQGGRLTDARVVVQIPPTPRREAVERTTLAVGDDGRFRLRVPGDRDLLLVGRDRLLRVPPTGGSVLVREARDDVVLPLVATR